MKVFRLFSVSFVLLVAIVGAHGQIRLTTSGASSAPSAVSPVAGNNFAVIDSGAFADEKGGIARVVAAFKTLNAKFEPIQKEIKGLQDQLTAVQNDAQKPNAQVAKLQDQANQLQLQIKRKGEDAQSNYDRELATLLDPIQTDIQTSLNAYATSHGILMIIDTNRVPVVYSHDSIDITKDFIAEYNRTHPVGAPAAPARP